MGCSGLLFEEGEEEGEEIAGDDLVSGGGGVRTVGLHHSGDAVDVLEQEGKQGNAVLPGEDGVGLVELADVVGAVVGREGDAGEGDLDAGALERGDDEVEVGASVCDGQAAQAVVAAELDEDDGGVQGENAGETLEGVLGGVAADALVVDAVVDVALVEGGLEVVGVALARAGASSGGERVAETDEEGAMVRGGGFGLRGGGESEQEARKEQDRVNFPH